MYDQKKRLNKIGESFVRLRRGILVSCVGAVFLHPLFIVIIIIIIVVLILILIIIMVGWVVCGGDARAGAVAKTRDCFRGLVGAASKQSGTGKTKQQAPSAGSCSYHTLPAEHKLKKLTSTRSRLRQRSGPAGGEGGEEVLMPDCLNVRADCCYSSCLFC